MISKICPITGLEIIKKYCSSELPELPNVSILNYEVMIDNVPILIQSLSLKESLITAENDYVDLLTSQRKDLISMIERKDIKVQGIFTWDEPREKIGLICLRKLLLEMYEKKINS